MGKVGATIGTQVLTAKGKGLSNEQKGQQDILSVESAVAVVGGIIAWVFVLDMEKDLKGKDGSKRHSEKKGFDMSGLAGWRVFDGTDEELDVQVG